jgi:hypothetical protein
MAREVIDLWLDLSNAANKRRLLASIGTLVGMYDIRITPRRAMRSNAANRYYWKVIVGTLVEFLNDQGQTVDASEVHELFKAKFLRRPIASPTTGEVIGQAIGSTTKLDTAQFADYIEKCRAWMLDMLGIVIQDQQEFDPATDQCANRRG